MSINLLLWICPMIFLLIQLLPTNSKLLCDVEIVMGITNVLQSNPKFEQTYSKPKIASFVILWQYWSFLKLISTNFMWILIGISHMTNSTYLWIWWGSNLMCYQQFGTLSAPHKCILLPFVSKNNFTCCTKLATTLELCTWSPTRIKGICTPRCEKPMHFCYKRFDNWTW